MGAFDVIWLGILSSPLETSLPNSPHQLSSGSPTGCDSTDCWSCLKNDSGVLGNSCVWCPATASCHNFGSPIDTCAIPINTAGQCWSASCPHQAGYAPPFTVSHALLSCQLEAAYVCSAHTPSPVLRMQAVSQSASRCHQGVDRGEHPKRDASAPPFPNLPKRLDRRV
jgi:hypothetical protein